MSISRLMQKAAAGAGEDVVLAEAVDFDGTNDVLTKEGLGSTNGKSFTFSSWVYSPRDNSGAGGSSDVVLQNEGARFYSRYQLGDNVGGQIEVICKNSSDTIILDVDTRNSEIPRYTWNHILISLDLANTSNRSVYVNDILISSPSWNVYTNDTIDFSAFSDDWGIGGSNTAGTPAKIRLSNVFLDYTYRDLSVEANRRLFVDYDDTGGLVPASGQASLSPILYLPMDDPEDPGRNEGTGGDFTLNGTIARSGRGPNQYNAPASTFDGSADYLNSSVTGLTDVKTITMSSVFNLRQRNTADYNYFMYAGGGRFSIRINSSDEIEFASQNPAAGDADLVKGTSNVAGLIKEGKYHHLAVSVDSSDPSKAHFYLDGEEVAMTFTSYVDAPFSFGSFDVVVSSHPSVDRWNGDVSSFYFDTTYIDLSADNPFYDVETGKPKFLGENGELPTGSSPLIYLPLRADDAGNNKGTGGDFTVNSGPFVGARGPSEFWGESADLSPGDKEIRRFNSGSNALDGVSDSKQFTLAMAFQANTTSNDDSLMIMTDGGLNSPFSVDYFSTDSIKVEASNSSGTVVLNTGSGGTSNYEDSDWHVLLLSADLSTQAVHMYIDNVDVKGFTETTNDFIFFSADKVTFGDDNFDGKIGFVWFNTEYVDLSQEANRLKFFDAYGYPVYVGEDGSLPTGNQPLIYLNKDIHLGINYGTGGDFSSDANDGGYVKG